LAVVIGVFALSEVFMRASVKVSTVSELVAFNGIVLPSWQM